MEKYSVTPLIKESLRSLRTVFLSILGGVVMGIVAAMIGSVFHVER